MDAHTLALRSSFRITTIYIVVALLWIFFSDQFLVMLTNGDPNILTVLQSLKGGLFVLVTGGLLFYLIYHQLLALRLEETRVASLNRVYRVLSGINGALLRIHEREALLEEACRIAVARGGYLYSGIMRLNADGTALVPEAATGIPANFGETLAEQGLLEWHAANPLWRTLNSPHPRVLHPATLEQQENGWHETMFAPGFGALAIFPIKQGKRVSGVMLFASANPHAFSDEECRLLVEMVADTALGLEYIDSAQHAQWMATHDPLTALPNRSLMVDRLQQAIIHHGKDHWTGIVVINLHRFHNINDAFGRDVGDRVIREVGNLITSKLEDDGSVARLASDEFLVIFDPVEEATEIEALTIRLLNAFPMLLQEEGHDMYISVRAGASIAPTDGDNAEQLLERAEIALHSGDRDEQNHCTFYGHEVDEAMRRRHIISQELHGALEREEFHLLYQPIVCLGSGRIAGMETLLRWENRHLGTVGPAEFIPIAEESGHIDHLGKWVLHEGSRQHREWLAKGHQVSLTVNVAARQLLGSDFTQLLEQVLAHYGVDADTSGLALEITETDLLHDMEQAVKVLGTVRDHGVQVYLDDFGTGYSSLSYLNRLPVHKVKVDGSFVAGLPDDPAKVALVRSIIGMAHSLGLEVVAEGVETKAQLKMLGELGCDSLQGYLFSRPLPATELEALLGRDQDWR